MLAAVLLFAPAGSLAALCWGGVELGPTVVFRHEGVNYFNCYLELAYDSETFWLTEVVLTEGAPYPDTDPLDKHSVRSISGELWASGKYPRKPHQITSVEGMKDLRRVREVLGAATSAKDHVAAVETIQEIPLTEILEIESKWSAELNQVIWRFYPEYLWKSAGPRVLIMSRSEWEKAGDSPWCEAYDELVGHLETPIPGKIKVVSKGESGFEVEELEALADLRTPVIE